MNAGAAPWLVLAILVVIAGLAAAAWLYRAGQPVPAMLACALTGLLVSPLSWDHHWVWVAPGIALLAHLGAAASAPGPGGVVGRGGRAGAGVRRLAAVLGPSGRADPGGPVLVGPATYFATGDQPWYHEFHWHGLQRVAGNSFVLAGLAGLATLVVAAVLEPGGPGP